ncbi:hypothetical protein MCP_1046 [Methanocella paludicola SANAE]|uniref:Uncharacterized protein n=1 Tax=Methanocella paludicola (strain DSM 17711 / JCM 13418 / NBRC 101707 / SANAE) TaxID=304371 RepID=D1YXE6_METPS|nr:hypothetical protein [Methanocella paludicola]BAI61118.1 hypothetical protein MCP_1046 [Methanocella paludicola SANAE]
MKADTMDPDLERRLAAVEEKVRSRRADPSILRRARRISRVKIYFLSRRKPGIPGCIRSLPFDGKVIISFIVSLFALSVPASFPHAQGGSPAVMLLKLLSGIIDFMATMVPLIIAVVGIYILFAILSRLVKDYTA